jgi:hypothetical protein
MSSGRMPGTQHFAPLKRVLATLARAHRAGHWHPYHESFNPFAVACAHTFTNAYTMTITRQIVPKKRKQTAALTSRKLHDKRRLSLPATSPIPMRTSTDHVVASTSGHRLGFRLGPRLGLGLGLGLG